MPLTKSNHDVTLSGVVARTILAGLHFGSVCVVIALASASLSAQDSNRFRGENGAGRDYAEGFPVQWSHSENITWKTELPGMGSSSPITQGDKIFVTCYSGYGTSVSEPGNPRTLVRHLVCLDGESGEILWDKEMPSAILPSTYRGFVAMHGYASSTPVADWSSVYVFFGNAGVYAFSHENKPLWETTCGKRTHVFGTGNSPILFQDKLIVNASIENGSIVALDKESGREVWKFPQEGFEPKDGPRGVTSSWNTPIIIESGDNGFELVFSMDGWIVGLNAETGELNWYCKGFKGYVCPSVVSYGGIIYALGSQNNRGMAIRAGGKGDVTDTHLLWEIDRGSNVTSPVYFDGHLYWAHETKGTVYCANAETGEIKYEQRLSPKPGKIYGSPIIVDGNIYYSSREAGTYVIAARPKFELVAHNLIEIDQSIFNASPVPMGNQLLLRSDTYLYCIGQE